MKLYRVNTSTGEGDDKREHSFLVRNVRSKDGASRKALEFLDTWYPEDYRALEEDPSGLYVFELSFAARDIVEL